MKTNALVTNTVFDNCVEPSKRSANNEQHVCRVYLNELLVRVLATTLRWHRSNRAFKNLEQRLLNTLTRDISRN